MKKLITLLCAGALAASLVACGQSDPPAASQPDTPSPDPTGSVSQPKQPPAQPDGSGSQEPQGQTATLYIGMDDSFQEYPLAYEGELTPELLIAGIADLTGWNLDLADAVTTGKDGMTVSLADTSSIFAGPPEEQKEQFHVYDVAELAASILDSIQHTLQYNFVDGQQGDPAALNIYYCNGQNENIVIPGLELSIPMDQPYTGLEFV